jgi:hypothetical protein
LYGGSQAHLQVTAVFREQLSRHAGIFVIDGPEWCEGGADLAAEIQVEFVPCRVGILALVLSSEDQRT